MLQKKNDISFVIEGDVPSKKNQMRIVKFGQRAGIKKSEGLKKYEDDFAKQVPAKHKTMDKRECRIFCGIYSKDNRKDTVNALAVIADCLQASGVIANDRQIIEARIMKFGVNKENPKLKIIMSFYLEKKHGK